MYVLDHRDHYIQASTTQATCDIVLQQLNGANFFDDIFKVCYYWYSPKISRQINETNNKTHKNR